MERVSTNFTLFWKLFFPIFWLVFFGIFTIASWAADLRYYGTIPGQQFKIGILIFFLTGAIFLLLTVVRLKRVEMDKEFIYVTNYFKNFRYPYHNIEKITTTDFIFFKSYRIFLKTPGHFGKKFTFIASENRLKEFISQHPDISELFKSK